MSEPTFEPAVAEATERAIAAATHLTDADAGAIETLRKLARKIDAWDQIVEWALDDKAGLHGWEGRPVVPEHDNVSIPTYLKFCDALGLTPAGRVKLPKPKETKPVGRLHAIQSAASATRGRAASGT